MFAYVGGGSFQKPLTKEEESEYLAAMYGGDAKARDVLIERNMRLVAHIVKKYTVFQRDTDELISIGTIGLIKAINTYKEGKGSKLATYAARCVENAMVA
jgi:RNA polymerase sporulation-specific sigma factor